jgi:hypothetical protein
MGIARHSGCTQEHDHGSVCPSARPPSTAAPTTGARRRRRRRRRRWRRKGAGEGGAHDAVAGEGGADEGGAGEGGAGEDGSDERDAGEGGADERGAGERGAGMGDDGLEHDHCKRGDNVSVKRARAGSVTQAEHSCAWRVFSARLTHL